MLRTYVYVDGFNLYNRALKNTKHKWLNIKALCEDVLGSNNQIERIKYFTARVKGRGDPDRPKRQQMYLNALKTLGCVDFYFGNFLDKKIWRPLVTPIPGGPAYVQVRTCEEKGSDVNLATHLVNDAWLNAYDVAVVMSNDTDLVEPIRVVVQDRKLPVGVICPEMTNQPAVAITKVASFMKHLTRPRLAGAQFPQQLANGVVCPPSWL